MDQAPAKTSKGEDLLVAVIDRSGSMHMTKTDAQGGFNALVEKQKGLQGGSVNECYMYAAEFDTVYDVIEDFTPLDLVKPYAMVPRGGTALFDAICKTIGIVGEYIQKLPPCEWPESVIFVIVTDGEENSSKSHGWEDVKDMIEHQTKMFDWEFIYVGANQDAMANAAKMGIMAGNVLDYNSTGIGTSAAYEVLTSGVSGKRTGEIPRGSATFSAEQQQLVKDAE